MFYQKEIDCGFDELYKFVRWSYYNGLLVFKKIGGKLLKMD